LKYLYFLFIQIDINYLKSTL